MKSFEIIDFLSFSSYIYWFLMKTQSTLISSLKCKDFKSIIFILVYINFSRIGKCQISLNIYNLVRELNWQLYELIHFQIYETAECELLRDNLNRSLKSPKYKDEISYI